MAADAVLFDSLLFGEILGKGGEATVYTLRHDQRTVAKLYHQPTPERAEKLRVMVENPLSLSSRQTDAIIAWPQRRIRTKTNSIVGFLMPAVPRGEPLANLYNMRARLSGSPYFHWRYLLRTAANLARSFSSIHSAGYVIGDVNDMGVVVTNAAIVSLVDCDSFQVRDPNNSRIFRCNVGIGMFTPPELGGSNFAKIDRTPNHDAFGIATMIYLLLMGLHPFSVKVKSGEQPSIEEAISRGLYPDSNSSVLIPPHASPIDIVPVELRKLFRSAFTHISRPTAGDWTKVLIDVEQRLKSCARNENHFFSGHLSECPWCERTLFLGRDPFPSNAAIARKEHLKAAVRTSNRTVRQHQHPPTATSTVPNQPTPRIPIPQTISTPAPSTTLTQTSKKADDGLPLVVAATTVLSLWAFAIGSNEWGIIWLIGGGAWALILLLSRERQTARSAASPPTPRTASRNYQRPAVTPGQQPPHITSQPPPSARTVSTGPQVVASAQRSKYHLEGCEWARKIRGRNRIVFRNPSEAVRYGLVPCGACRPPST